MSPREAKGNVTLFPLSCAPVLSALFRRWPAHSAARFALVHSRFSGLRAERSPGLRDD